MEEKKLYELLDKMSVEDKLGELWQVQSLAFDATGVLTGGADVNQEFIPERVWACGSTLNLNGKENIKAVQEDHLAHNKHKIPMLFMADIIHGYVTIFPIPLASSCSFDTELIKDAYHVVAKESAAAGMHVTFYPMIDLSRDPRWGRVMEGAGEDPYLCSEVCRAIVEGLQGDGLDKPDTLAACIKHFAGYGAAEGGRDYNTVNLGERALRQYYLPGYKGGVDAGAAMVMTSYNAVDGVPSNCNKWLIRDVLKGEWGFKGVVITDLFATKSLASHGIGDDKDNLQYRAKVSLEAGVDIEMGSDHFFTLAELVKEGKLDEAIIDEACMRVLKLKNDLGLFENPYRMASDEECEKILGCSEHVALAKKLATESCVLLKNEDKTLPLGKQSGKLAFIGPAVMNESKKSSWVLVSDNGAKKLFASLREAVEVKHPEANVKFAKGCSFLGREQAMEAKRFGYCDEETREQTINEAVKLAKEVDTVVLTLGESPNLSGEAHSRGNIRIPDVQLELYRRVREVAKKVVVLVYTGRPLDLSDIQDADAILNVWYLGDTMPEAVTDLVFGDAVPSGRLTMAFPTSVNQIPVYYNYLRTDHTTDPPYISDYQDGFSYLPRYPFGYGLTYSELEYSETKVEKTEFGVKDTVTASVEISNKGDYDVVEVVQLYVQDVVAAIAPPIKELKGFKRIAIKAGETARVEFEIREDMLRYWNLDMKYESDAGQFGIAIKPDSSFPVSEFTKITLNK